MFGNFFGAGGGGGFGGGYYDKEYMERMERERAERRLRLQAEQQAIDAETDPAKQLELRRQRYRCGDHFVTLDDIPSYLQLLPELAAHPNHSTVPPTAPGGGGRGYYSMPNDTVTFKPEDSLRRKSVNEAFNSKISIFRGDITQLELDAIVNAANSSLLGGGGIDGAIHGAAGPLLVDECRGLGGCPTGNTKITKGYCLPAKHVLHTVGPIGKGDKQLRGCYRTSLELVRKHRLRTVAFCCVGTGIFSFPLVRATHIALSESRKWLEEVSAAVPTEEDPNPYTLNDIDRIVFCVFKPTELECYERIAPGYFPMEGFPAAAIPEGTVADPYNEDNGSPDPSSGDDDDVYGAYAAYPPRGGGGGGAVFRGRGHGGGGGGFTYGGGGHGGGRY